jgi:hypothetical protein
LLFFWSNIDRFSTALEWKCQNQIPEDIDFSMLSPIPSGSVRVARPFNYPCCVVFVCFVCLRLVSTTTTNFQKLVQMPVQILKDLNHHVIWFFFGKCNGEITYMKVLLYPENDKLIVFKSNNLDYIRVVLFLCALFVFVLCPQPQQIFKNLCKYCLHD